MTTFLAYLMTPKPYEQVLPQVIELAEEHAAVDFGLHFCIVTEEQRQTVAEYARLGVSSFKFFMNFRGDEGAYLGLPGNDDGFLFELLRETAGCGALVNPHPESYLIDAGADTVVVTGCTTSGCVRATAVDAFSYNFHVLVPEECVYDRSPTVHAVNLFDITQKYADVMPVEGVLAAVEEMARASRG